MGKPKFTRMPKVNELVSCGIPYQAIGTLAALSDHANNKTGLCFPSMKRLSDIVGCSYRTIQRHLLLLKEKGFIEFVSRRRQRNGRFSSYLYRVVHIAQATGHHRASANRGSNRRRTRQQRTLPQTPSPDAFNWFFGKERNLEAEAEHRRHQQAKREAEAKRRREGYEWLFGG